MSRSGCARYSSGRASFVAAVLLLDDDAEGIAAFAFAFAAHARREREAGIVLGGALGLA